MTDKRMDIPKGMIITCPLSVNKSEYESEWDEVEKGTDQYKAVWSNVPIGMDKEGNIIKPQIKFLIKK